VAVCVEDAIEWAPWEISKGNYPYQTTHLVKLGKETTGWVNNIVKHY